MKALRYLLMIVAMVSVLSVCAQNLAQQPVVEMKSTSVMVGSGSSLPQAAMTGTVTTYSSGSPAKSSKPRRDPSNPFDGGGTAGDVDNPLEPGTPIGDAALPLALCALAYALMRVFLKKKRA